MHLDQSIQFLRGVGPARAEAFARIGVYTLRDLLYHAPRTYQDWTSISTFADLCEGVPALLRGRVIRHLWVPVRRGRPLLKIVISDQQQTGSLVCFNRPHLAKKLEPGVEVLVYGRFSFRFGEWQCSVFDSERLDQLHSAAQFVPVYPLSEGLSQDLLRGAVKSALSECSSFADIIPEYLVEKRSLGSFSAALQSLHFPSSLEEAEQARRRLAYRELLLFECLLGFRRSRVRLEEKQCRYMEADYAGRVEAAAGFCFTAGQRAAAEEVLHDLYKAVPMQRIIIGDVGSGKTAVACVALIAAAASGFQAAVLAPTVILAQQLYERLSGYMPEYRMLFLSGRQSAAEKKQVCAAVADGSCTVLVGTHALFSEAPEFQKLGLVIVDEQHRFGVRQRQALRSKGQHVDYLSMSATPIPRSLALALYGDLDLSMIKDVPAGRKAVGTYWLRGSHEKAYAALLEALDQGNQGYIVYPLIEENADADLQALEDAFTELRASLLASCRCAMLHGRMKDAAKLQVMKDFAAGSIQVLLSTTVIEVGIDNPAATVMIIQDAQQYGLSQLHQLRGRVGRSSRESLCFLLSPERLSDTAEARMRIMTTSNDGFLIAREDLKLRGQGDILGEAQSGLPQFLFADIYRDEKGLERAQADAMYILKHDTQLVHPVNSVLKDYCVAILPGEA